MRKFLHEARILIALVIPVILAQGSQTMIGFMDIMIAGNASKTDLAAVALGTSIWLPIILFCNGILLALTPIIAQLKGSQQDSRISHPIQQGFWLATALAIIAMVVLYNSNIILELARSDASDNDHEVIRIATGYLRTILWGAPGFLYFQVLRSQCEGIAHTKPGMVIGLIALIINVPINYIFIYGKFGLPALGGIGCGVASGAVYWLMFVMIRIYTKRSKLFVEVNRSSHFEWPNGKMLKQITLLGFPIAIALFSEVSLFEIVTILIAPLGDVVVSGHQVTLSLSSVLFVLPMSMGIAATIRTGNLLGQRQFDEAKIAGYTSLILGIIIAIIMTILSIYFRTELAMLFSDNIPIITLASHLIIFAAIYQCSDAVQAIGAGILRGYKDTQPIFIITLISYWMIGFPIGYTLALTDLLCPRMGAAGFWIGFIIGLSCSACLMILRIRFLQKLPNDKILARINN